MSSEPLEFQLTVPDSVAADPDSVEMLRFWWSRGEPVMAIKPAFEDPKMYGAMLAIAARNIAFVYHTNKGLDQEATYQVILSGLKEALGGPGFVTVAEDAVGSRT